MSAADEYQRVLGEHGWHAKARRCACRWRPSHAIAQFPDPPTPPLFEQYSAHVAQALAADLRVRAAVEREARAEALREFRAGVEAAFPPERFPREWALGEDRRSGTVRHVLDMLSDRAARLSTAMTPYRQEPSAEWSVQAENGTRCYASRDVAEAVAAGDSGYTLGVDCSPLVQAYTRDDPKAEWSPLTLPPERTETDE